MNREDISSNTPSTISQTKKTINFNELMIKGDNSKYPLLALLNILSVLLIDGLEKFLYSFLIIPINDYFNFKEFETECCSAIFFLGLALGSMSGGYLTKNFKRETVLKSCSFSFVLLHLIFSIFYYRAIFFICRFFIGFGLGIYTPICLNLYCEYLPSENRGFRLQVVWVSFSVANLFLIYIVMILMPNFQSFQLKKVLLISEIIPIISFLINIFTLYDSPRHLIINNEYDKAFQILENMNNNEKFTEDEKISIINDIKCSQINCQVSEGNIKDMFNSYYRTTTLIIMLLFFITACGCFGIPVVTTFTSRQLNINQGKEDNHSIIITQLIIALIGLISNIFAGFLINLKCLGRKGCLILSLIFQILLSVFSINFPKFFAFLIGFSQFFANIFANVLIAYNVEVYLTKIRDIASGFNLMIYRMFCMFSQFIFLQMNSFDYRVPYYSLACFSFIGIFFVYLLPYETTGKEIDSDFNFKENLLDLNKSDEGKSLLNDEDIKYYS